MDHRLAWRTVTIKMEKRTTEITPTGHAALQIQR
jgi:hypothetical protein